MIHKILVPLDGSELAEKAIPNAVAIAQKFEAEIIVAHVLEPVLVMTDYSHAALYDQKLWKNEAEMTLYIKNAKDELVHRHPNVRGLILKNLSSAEALVDLAATEQVDLIVMSTHGRSGLSRWIHGSVATKILHHAPCPVYLVRVSETKPKPTEAEKRSERVPV